MLGVDRATPFSPDEAVRLSKLGYRLVCRYYRRSLVDPTLLGEIEADALQGAGMSILPVFEYLADPAMIDGPNGIIDGTAAKSCAQTAGQPVRSPICFAFDFDWNESLLPQTVDYLNNVAEGLAGEHPVWIYGPSEVLACSLGLRWDAARGVYIPEHDPWPGVAGRWQAQAAYAWSQGRNAYEFPHADIIQVKNGVSITGLSGPVDIDHVQTDIRDLWRAL